MFHVSAEFGACIFLVALGFVNCTQTTLAVALLTLGATLHGAVYSSFLVNPMDIAPQFAGTIFGISNMLGAATGFIAPPVAAALTPNVSLYDRPSSVKARKLFYVLYRIIGFEPFKLKHINLNFWKTFVVIL